MIEILSKYDVHIRYKKEAKYFRKLGIKHDNES